jgi:hypothetical protein
LFISAVHLLPEEATALNDYGMSFYLYDQRRYLSGNCFSMFRLSSIDPDIETRNIPYRLYWVPVGSDPISSVQVFYKKTSVADPGCFSRIPDPDFYPSRIPDPKTATKERGKEN